MFLALLVLSAAHKNFHPSPHTWNCQQITNIQYKYYRLLRPLHFKDPHIHQHGRSNQSINREFI